MQRAIELHQTGFDGQAGLLGPGTCFLCGFVPAKAAFLVAHDVEQINIGAPRDVVDQPANLEAKGVDSSKGGQSGIRLAFVRLDRFGGR
jgi:hypothetical protein